jgi:hypothetical protein
MSNKVEVTWDPENDMYVISVGGQCYLSLSVFGLEELKQQVDARVEELSA